MTIRITAKQAREAIAAVVSPAQLPQVLYHHRLHGRDYQTCIRSGAKVWFYQNRWYAYGYNPEDLKEFV